MTSVYNHLRSTSPVLSGGCLISKNKLSVYLLGFIISLLVMSSTSSFATVYYVSSKGNDSKSGTSPAEAWRTLNKVNSFTPKPGDKILFKRGEQWVGTIEVNASGSSGSPIIYGAYGSGEKPKILGSEVISNWAHHSGKIYKAKVNNAISQLFIEGDRLKLARYPNEGYLTIKTTNGKGWIYSPDLNPGYNYSGATIVVRTEAWAWETESVNSSGSYSLSVSSPYYNYDAGEGFFMTNKLVFLDEPGEWHYDKSTHTVYMWSPDGNGPDSHLVRGSFTDYGFKGTNISYVSIENLDICQQTEDAIYFTNADYIKIDNCIISDQAKKGINIESAGSNNATISNNTVDGAVEYGIRAYGDSHLITENTVQNIGLTENVGTEGFGNMNAQRGIHVEGGNYNTVSYNVVQDINYNGINFYHAPYTTVEYNYINNVCILKDDGAAIYAWNDNLSNPGCENSVIRYNIIDYVPGNADGYTYGRGEGAGIYMDEKIHDVVIEYNTIAHTSLAGVLLHQNEDVTVRYNTVFNSRYGLWPMSKGSGVRFTNNKIYVLDEDMSGYITAKLGGKYYTSATISYNYNTYINHYNSSDVFRINATNYDFSGWKSATGQDANSTIDLSPLASGETEKLFYNNSKQTKNISLGTSVYKDIYNNKVSGTLTLKPFTSKILIGTNVERIETNKSPEIQNQTFDISTDLSTNDFIGQVAASDPDNGQILTYSITEGNQENLFYIDANSGEIYAKTTILANQNKSVNFVVTVTDNATSPLSVSATITINIVGSGNNDGTNNGTDTTAPVIASFSMPQTTNSLNIPVSTFEATDNIAVTAYLITQSENPPSNDDAWMSTVPKAYTVSVPGTYTLYAWTKDKQGNISNPVSSIATVELTDSNIEYISICEGEDYMGWTESGIYKHIGTQTTIVTSGNQIKNSDFTIGNEWWGAVAADGNKASVVTNKIDYISPPASLQVTSRSDGTYISSQQLMIYDNIVIEAGKIYEFSFYAKATKKFTIGGIFIHQSRSPWEKIDALTFNPTHLTFSEEWTQYKITLKPEISTQHANIRFYLGNSLQKWNSMFIDDVVFSEIAYTGTTDGQEITTYLTVNPVQYTTETIDIMEGENYLGWTESGEYERTLISSTGCDSIVTTILEVASLKSAQIAGTAAKINQQKQPMDDSSFVVYPNPANGYVNIDIPLLPEDKTTLEIFNNNGNIVFSKLVETPINKINLNHLPPGLYYIRMKSKTGINSQKLIVR